jgi:hypothetical protein
MQISVLLVAYMKNLKGMCLVLKALAEYINKSLKRVYILVFEQRLAVLLRKMGMCCYVYRLFRAILSTRKVLVLP